MLIHTSLSEEARPEPATMGSQHPSLDVKNPLQLQTANFARNGHIM